MPRILSSDQISRIATPMKVLLTREQQEPGPVWVCPQGTPRQAGKAVLERVVKARSTSTLTQIPALQAKLEFKWL